MRKHETQILYSEMKKINLVNFIEKETKVSFNKSGDRFNCICPMPFHKEKLPSFFVMQNGEDWWYHCFGCQSNGSIIDFCMAYFSFDYPTEALIFLSKRMGIKSNHELIIKSIKEAKIEYNKIKKLDGEHFLASKRCYALLRKFSNNEEIRKWIAGAYWKMNKFLVEENINEISKIGDDALALLKNTENTESTNG